MIESKTISYDYNKKLVHHWKARKRQKNI
jgi:hypothetical protein